MTANIADVFGFGRRMPSKLCVWMAVVHLLIGVALNDATNVSTPNPPAYDTQFTFTSSPKPPTAVDATTAATATVADAFSVAFHSHTRQPTSQPQITQTTPTANTTAITQLPHRPPTMPTTRRHFHWQPFRKRRSPAAAAAAATADAVEAAEEACPSFIAPNTDNNTFFSPMNPKSAIGTYPPKIDCTFVLEAPPGQLIKLDFRNVFHIEESPGCEFDYLEVHDGKHGFAKELGRYCGDVFPQIIYSSDRYLWLHFHSDENIEYEGFQAVYEFLPRTTTTPLSDSMCVYNKSGYEGYVTHEDIAKDIIENSQTHKLSLDCLWRIEVEENWNILLTFDEFDLERKNDCESNFIDVFGQDTDIPSRLKNFCGVIAEAVVSKQNVLHIRFFAEYTAVLNTKFQILFTAFRSKAKGTECADGEFDCDDDTCINEKLYCNKHNNCKFLKDENECPSDSEKGSGNLVIIITVFCLILAAMIAAFLFNCIRKLMRDQKIIREHIRQSKESKLDEAGRMSLKRSLENINRIHASQPLQQPLHPRHMSSATVVDSESMRYYREPMSGMATITSMEPLNRKDQKNDQNYRNLEDATSRANRKRSSGQTVEEDAVDVLPTNMCDIACQTRGSLLSGGSSITQSSRNRDTPSVVPSAQRSQSGGGGGGSASGNPPRFSTFGYSAANVDSRAASEKSSQPGTNSTYDSHYHTHSHPQPHSHSHSHSHSHHSHQHGHHQHHQQQSHPGTPDGNQPTASPSVHQQSAPAASTAGVSPLKSMSSSSAASSPASQAIHSSNSSSSFANRFGGHSRPAAAGVASKKMPPPTTVTEESRIYVDIRNSAPDVIIMTSH